MCDWYWMGGNWEPALDYEGRLQDGVGSATDADWSNESPSESSHENSPPCLPTSKPEGGNCTPAGIFTNLEQH